MAPDDVAPHDVTEDGVQLVEDGAIDDGATDDVPEPPLTGDAGVDRALAGLADAVRGPLDGQVAAYDAAHRTLQDRLADGEG
jgi:hypothetical protein